MSDRFSESQMLRLVEVYRDYECLWNMGSELYKNREARRIAYKEIYKRLNIPGLTIKDIPKKIKNLRSSYCQELKKIENSMREGHTENFAYEPKVSWFSPAESYLAPFIKRQDLFLPTNNNSNNKEDLPVEKSVKMEIKQDDDSEDEGLEEESTTSMKKCSLENRQPLKYNQISSRSSLSRNDQDMSQVLSKIEKLANNITKCAENLSNKEDEFDIFGRYIAKTLRSLPRELSVVAKLAIQKSVSDIQIKAVKKEKSTGQGCSSTTEFDE